MYKILGISEKRKGEYNGRPWSNTLIFAVNFDAQHIKEGVWVDTLKVPDRIDISSLKVGDEVNVYYNRYGNIDVISKV